MLGQEINQQKRTENPRVVVVSRDTVSTKARWAKLKNNHDQRWINETQWSVNMELINRYIGPSINRFGKGPNQQPSGPHITIVHKIWIWNLKVDMYFFFFNRRLTHLIQQGEVTRNPKFQHHPPVNLAWRKTNYNTALTTYNDCP